MEPFDRPETALAYAILNAIGPVCCLVKKRGHRWKVTIRRAIIRPFEWYFDLGGRHR